MTNKPATTNTNTNDNPQQDAWQLRELGVFWKRKKQTSTESYLVGTINLKNLGFDKDVPVVVFSNKRKNNDTHPDLRMYISEKPSGQSTTANTNTAPVKKPFVKQQTKVPVPTQESETGNDLI